MCVYFLAMMLSDPSTASGAVALTIGAALMFIIFGYFIGLAPALVTGILFAFSPPALQRVALSAVYGAASVWLVNKVADVTTRGALGGGAEPFMLAAGAFAAVCCALIAKRAGWLGGLRSA